MKNINILHRFCQLNAPPQTSVLNRSHKKKESLRFIPVEKSSIFGLAVMAGSGTGSLATRIKVSDGSETRETV